MTKTRAPTVDKDLSWVYGKAQSWLKWWVVCGLAAVTHRHGGCALCEDSSTAQQIGAVEQEGKMYDLLIKTAL